MTLLLFVIFLTSTVHVVTSPTARVVSVDHPNRLLPGKSFQVTVVVEYSDKFLVDVGIWDSRLGLMVQSLTLISQFTGPGRASFTFQLTAPSTDGDWHLVAMTRVWWQDAWYQDPNGGLFPFNITISNTVTLSLSLRGANASFTVDNSQYQISERASLTLPLQPGIHTMEAPNFIQGATGERVVFAGWSDGVNSNPRRILLAQDTNIQVFYRTEYYLSVKSNFTQATGEGWYGSGEQATFAVAPIYDIPSWFGFLTEEYRFSGWSGQSNSTNEIATLTMSGPKSVNANWVYSGTKVDLTIIGDIIFLGSLPLATRALIVYAKRRRMSSQILTKTAKLAPKLMALLIVLVASMLVSPAQAQLPIQPNATVVKIGDAHWYYWNQPGSDTCILWLGGGIPEETAPGYYAYWINPFDYESFGTIHFIQDLTKYYCVVALQEGASQAYNPTANRTINGEFLQPQSTTISQVHEWIRQQGYQHTFFVGYSVGGQAAAMEVVFRDPEGWTGLDGLVLITVPVAKNLIEQAHALHANLLLLYGGNLPDYEATGQLFYENAPSEGSHGLYYFHKEFHVLEDVGHEVWTVRDTGTYSSRALSLVAGFIERSKALQLRSEVLLGIGNSTSGNWMIKVTSVRAPSKVAEGAVLALEANVEYATSTGAQTVLVAYDLGRHEVVSTAAVSPTSSGNRTIRLVIPPSSNSSQLSFSVVVLQKSNQEWVPVSEAFAVRITVTNLVTLTIETPVPSMPVQVDSTQYQSNSSGSIEIETARGSHSVQVQPILYQSNVSRLQFTEWEDSSNATLRQIDLNDDTTLVAIYQEQYFVNLVTPFGTPEGSGWYDGNSIAILFVQPPVIQQPPVLFAHWAGDSNDRYPRTLIAVDSPKNVDAIWNQSDGEQGPTDQGAFAWVALSVLVFVILLIMNLKPHGPIRN
jgi:hypothetical protein